MKQNGGFKRPCLLSTILVLFLCSSELLATLTEAAGSKDWGWSEWASRPELPVAASR